MKADDYAKRILAAPMEATAAEASLVALDMIKEIMEIGEQREARSNQSMLAIIKEQGVKWLAIVERCEDYVQLNPAGFRIVVLRMLPKCCAEIPYNYWSTLWPKSTMSLTVRALENKLWLANGPTV